MTDTISKQALLDTIEITSFEDYGDYITVRELIENFLTIENEPQTSKIIEAYSRGFEDGAEAVKTVNIKALHKDYKEPYVSIEQTEPQTDWGKEKTEKSLCNSCVKECDDRTRTR